MLGFDPIKTIQAAAYFLKLEPGKRTNYMRLLKLLYLADRKSLELRGAPLCGDTPYAMERGPVPSVTFDMLKGNDPESPRWSEFITKIGYDVRLVKDPGNLALSRAELKILYDLSEEFRDKDEWDMVNWCHKNLPEYQECESELAEKKRVKIPFESILAAIGRAGQRDAIIQQLNADKGFAKLFADHAPSS
jgi:hypothetical protein